MIRKNAEMKFGMVDDQNENLIRGYQNTNQVCLPTDDCICVLTDLKNSQA